MAGLDALAVGGGVTDPKDARHATGGLLAVQGPTELDIRTGVMVGPSSTALVTGTSDTGQMTVLIGVHHAVTTRGSANGPYVGPTLDAATKVNVGAAPGSGSRIDVVYVKQQDGNSGVPSPDVATAPLYGVLPGTVSTGTPSKPDLTTIVGAEELATVQVSAGATATNGSSVTITNTAKQTVARGAPIPVRSQAERDALSQYDGRSVKRLDLGGVEQQRINGAWKTVTTDPIPVSVNGGPSATITTDSAGNFTVTHNLGSVPSNITMFSKVVGVNGGHVFAFPTATSTQFTGRCYYNNAAQVNTTLAVYWRADA